MYFNIHRQSVKLGNGFIWHGSAGTTLVPHNYQEELKQWTNIFGVSMTSTDTKPDNPEAKYKSDYGLIVQGFMRVLVTQVQRTCLVAKLGLASRN
jgi:hypothetical protein